MFMLILFQLEKPLFQWLFLNNLNFLEVHHVMKILCGTSFMFFELSIAFEVNTTLTAFIWECTTTV